VFIGNQAGAQAPAASANKLYIANTNTLQPPIFGQMDNNQIGIAFADGTDSFGGTKECLFIHNTSQVPTGNPVNGGVLYVSAGNLRYVGPGGTDTLVAAT